MIAYLRHLANFAHVVNAGSITASAKREGVSPSTMSESVKVVEGFVGRPLLERNKSGVRLLSGARGVYDEANAIVDALNRVTEFQRSADIAGELRISLPIEIANAWFPEALSEICRRYPDLRPVVMAEDHVIDPEKYTRDLYLRVGPGTASPSEMKVLFRAPSRAILVAAPELAAQVDVHDPEAIAQHRFLCAPSATPEARLSMSLGPDAPKIVFAKTLRVNDITTRLGYARRGLGIAGGLHTALRDDLEAGRLVELLPDQFDIPLTLWLGTARRRPSPAVRAVAEVIAPFLGAAVAPGTSQP